MKDYSFKVSSWVITILCLCFSAVIIVPKIDKLFTTNGYILCILLLILVLFSVLSTFNTKIRKYIINCSSYMISYKLIPYLYFWFYMEILGNYSKSFARYDIASLILLVMIGVCAYILYIFHLKNKSKL